MQAPLIKGQNGFKNPLCLSLLVGLLCLITAHGFSVRLKSTSESFVTTTRSPPCSMALATTTTTESGDSRTADDSQALDPILAEAIQAALAKMHVLMKPGFFEAASCPPLLNKLYKNCVNMVQVAPSSIPGAGLGVFATKNIPKGTFISFYTTHGIGIDYGDSSICLGSRENPADQSYFRQRPDNSKSQYLHYLIGSRPLGRFSDRSFPLFIDVNPNQPIVPGWIGHIVNDGATVLENSERGALDYYDASRKAKNCIHVPFGPSPMLATMTTRKVKKGEELFTSYGFSFWLEELLRASGNDEEEPTDITNAIQAQAQASAKDLFAGMQNAKIVYEKEAACLHNFFNSL